MGSGTRKVGAAKWEDESHGRWEQGSGKKDHMGSGTREVGRRITWEAETGKWVE